MSKYKKKLVANIISDFIQLSPADKETDTHSCKYSPKRTT